MNRILIDTMYISALLTDEDDSYNKLAQAIDDDKIAGIISVVTLTELVTILGIKIYKEKINQLITSKLILVDINLLDICNMIISDEGLGIPIDSKDSIRKLCQCDVIPESLASRLEELTGLKKSSCPSIWQGG